MAKQTRKSTPRLSCPPPGTMVFAEGGKVETADELMARIAGKYGVTGQAQAAPVQQPVPQPQPKAQPLPQQKGLGGIIGIIKSRQLQIDKAAEGYANGGKIAGPGTAKSDSIPAKIRESGEPIKVSTGERIVSAEQDAFLESVAQSAGYESLDQMLEDGTGKPVGPTIKAGKRAAATGMAPETDPDTDGRRQYSAGYGDSFANRGASTGNQRVDTAIVAPPTLGGAPVARTEPAGTLSNPSAAGLTIDPFGPKPEKLGSGLSGIDPSFAPGQAQQPVKPGRDSSGIITADSAQAAAGADMQRPGGISGGIDMAGVNGILARENKARGEMIDSMIAANGGNGINILSDGGIEAANAEKTARWRQDELIDKASRGNQGAVAAAIHANASGDAEARRNEIAMRGQDLGYGARLAAQGLTARGQDLGLQRAQDRNDVMTRGQDVRAGTAADRTASNEAIATARITERSGPTLSQQRGNAEIGAARERIAGLTPEEIKRKTQQFSATGRENPEYDSTLAISVKQANLRMVGDDQEFDTRQQQAQPVQQPKAATFTRDDVHAAINAGADRAKVIERIKSMGGNPADYGL